MTEIKEALVEMNPWWKGEFKLDFKEREVYKEILRFIPLKQMLAFTGLRRAGKTTLMLKIAQDAILQGIGPKRVIYFSFDEFAQGSIREVLKQYERVCEMDLRQGKYLLLLDELQKVNNWENQLKAIYDSFRANVKIIISGSESLFVRKKSKETLAGRLFEFRVEPLNFREFLAFKNASLKPVQVHEKELYNMLNEFALTGGFPELVGVSDRTIIRKYIRESIMEKVIYKDIATLYNVMDASILDSLLSIISEEPGQIIELAEFASDLKISRQTLSSYLTYLEQAFLIKKLYNFSRNRRKTERKLKKYYPAVAPIDLLFRDDNLSKSKAFEWLVVRQLNAEFFWRDPYKNEVDIVLQAKSGEPLPVKVKYGKPDISGLLAFMKKFKADKGYVVSPDTERELKISGKTVFTVPAFKLLLNPDSVLKNQPSETGGIA